jgi:hypothetical protein
MDLMPLNSDDFGNPLEVKQVKKPEPTTAAKNEKQEKDQEKKQDKKKEEEVKPLHQPLPGGSIDLSA